VSTCPPSDANQGVTRLAAVHLYPATMNTYGDRGNVAALSRRAQWRQLDLRWHPVELGQPAPEHPDLVFMGGGQDRVQHAIAEDLVQRREWLRTCAAGGTVIFAVCAGFQLLGRSYTAADGSRLEGVGLLAIDTAAAQPGEWRLIGNTVVEVHTPHGPRILAGFENHGGRTYLHSVPPLGMVRAGHGNNGRDGTEGAYQGTVIATYLHGPVLPKNAWLTDHLLHLALRHAGADPALLTPLDDSFETAAQEEAVARANTAERTARALPRRLSARVCAPLRRARR